MGESNKAPLTMLELEVARLLLQGYSASQMAKRLFRSKRTIEHRLEQIKEKLSCSSKAELIQRVRKLEALGVFVDTPLQ